MGKKGDLSDSERGRVVGARRAVFKKIFKKSLTTWDFHAQPSLQFIYIYI